MPPRKKPAPTPEPKDAGGKEFNYFKGILPTPLLDFIENLSPPEREKLIDEVMRQKLEIERSVLRGEPTELFAPPKAAEPTFVLHRATKGSQRTFLMATYPCEKKHEHRVNPLTTSDGEFIFRVPQHCPICGEVYYYLKTEGDTLKPMDHAPMV